MKHIPLHSQVRMQEVAANAPVVAPDPDVLRLRAVHRAAAELRRGTPVVLTGESYGGYLSRGLIAKRPEQVLGLGLICSIGIELENADRTVPDHVVNVSLRVPINVTA